MLVEKIEQVYEANYSVYGARKVWAELNRQGSDVALLDVFARLIVGWQVATSLYTDLALDAAADADLAPPDQRHRPDRARASQRPRSGCTGRSGTPNGSPTPARSPRSAPRGTLVRDHGPGAASTTWKSPTGTTIDASHPPSTKHHTRLPTQSPHPWKPANPLSTKSGA
ncbi:IS3 family transposase [Actinophytocola sp.]|uniref:IS3 family transposase n=1 Tax=Actinophytocola sp. TaxID=1872138 RepID=UPI003D6A2C37